MNIDLSERSLTDQIKILMAYRGLTQKELREEYNKRYGTNYTKQSFSNKFSHNRMKAEELKKFGDILGFKVKLELTENTM